MSSDVSAHIDPSKPSIARVYDAALGGKDNFAADRAVLQALMKSGEEALSAARDNRAWLTRVTRYLAAEAGIRQFLDLGSGLPTVDNTHQIAQRCDPECLVVYVDNDPTVCLHGRSLLECNDRTRFVAADLTKPREVLAEPAVSRFLDMTAPVALFQIGTLHHYPGVEALRDIMRSYVDALAPGSYVAISHFFDPGGADGPYAKAAQDVMTGGPLGSGYFRTREEIASLFAGLELVEPGLVPAAHWWADGPGKRLNLAQRLLLAGLGRKP